MAVIEQKMRTQIASFLPSALRTAMDSYKAFSVANAYEGAKEFKTHHDACKVAIAHIDLLIKLAQWADLPDPAIEDEVQHSMLSQLIENARCELSGYDGQSDENLE